MIDIDFWEPGVQVPSIHVAEEAVAVALTWLRSPWIVWSGTDQRINVRWADKIADRFVFKHKTTLSETLTGQPGATFVPAIGGHDSRIAIGWAGTDQARSINLIYSSDGDNFGDKVTLDESAIGGPGLLWYRDRLYACWMGRDQRITIVSSADGASFDQKIVLDELAQAPPALGQVGGRLCISWMGTDRALNLISTADGTTFDNKITFDLETRGMQSLCTFRSNIYIAFNAPDGMRLMRTSSATQPFEDVETRNGKGPPPSILPLGHGIMIGSSVRFVPPPD
jgi:hypothetical protein